MTHSCCGGICRHGRSCRLPFIEFPNVFVSLFWLPSLYCLFIRTAGDLPLCSSGRLLPLFGLCVARSLPTVGQSGLPAQWRPAVSFSCRHTMADKSLTVVFPWLPAAVRLCSCRFRIGRTRRSLPYGRFSADCRSVRLFLFEELYFCIPAESALRCRAPSFS